MVQKYIIDKTDIHDLLTGKEIPLPQGRARAFCVEIAGKITNGDMIKAMFGFEPRKSTCILPKDYCNGNPAECDGCKFNEWWNSPYKAESDE